MVNVDTFFNALTAVSTLITVYVLWLTQDTNYKALETGRQNLDANTLLKQIDVYNACSQRYDLLTAEALRLSKQNIDEQDGEGFYLRYWELQHNQFIFFQRGYIDLRIMISWMNWRKEEFRLNKPLSNSNNAITYQWGWHKAAERFKNTEFTNFIDRVISGDPERVVREADLEFDSLKSEFMRKHNRSPKLRTRFQNALKALRS